MATKIPVNTNAPSNPAPANNVKASNSKVVGYKDQASLDAAIARGDSRLNSSNTRVVSSVNESLDSTPKSGKSSAPVYSPAVITSNKAQDNLNTIKDFYDTTNTAVTDHATKVAENNAKKQADDAAALEKKQADKLVQDKLAIEQQQANAKTAAVTGTSPGVYKGVAITPGDQASIQAQIAKIDAGQPTTSETTPAPALTPQEQITTNLNTENQSYQDNMVNQLNEQEKAYNDFKSSVNRIKNGTFPLSTSQQSLVDSTSQAFDQMMEQSRLRGAALSSQTGAFSNKITQTMGELSNIETQKAAALAKMEIGFQDENYKMISDAYTAYTNHEKDTTNILMNLHKDVVDQANAQRQYEMDVKKIEQSASQFQSTMALEEKKFAFDKAIKYEELALQKRANAIQEGLLSNATTVPLNSGGQPDKTAQTAFLATLPPATATAVKGLADYTLNPTNFDARLVKGQLKSDRDMLTSLAKEYDPNYDQNQYAARSKFLNSWKGGGMSASNNAINTAMQHLTELKTAADAIQNAHTGIASIFTKKYNDIGTYLKENQGSTEVKNYGLIRDTVAAEIAKAYKNGINSNAAPSSEEIDDYKARLDKSITPEQASGVVNTALNLLNDKINVNKDQFYQTMNRTPQSIILPSTMQKLGELKNNGMDLKIDGVLYTNKDAYIKSTPDAPTKLYKAWQQLSQANDPSNPANEENILQLAQILQ